MGSIVPMEGLVRPFQSVTFFPGPSTLPPKEIPGIVQLQLGGAGGTTTSFTLDGNGSYSTYDDDFKESNRQSTLVRVENEDDPDSFVEFCRADKIEMTSRNPKKTPTKTSSYDPQGGQYDTTGGMNGRDKKKMEFQYPTDKTCKPKNPPKGGNC